MNTTKIKYEIKDDVVYLGFGLNNNKTMTVLDRSTLEELGLIIEDVKEKQSNYKGLVFYSLIKDCFWQVQIFQ